VPIPFRSPSPGASFRPKPRRRRRVSTDFEMERWHVDAEAARREARWRELEAAATVIAVARGLTRDGAVTAINPCPLAGYGAENSYAKRISLNDGRSPIVQFVTKKAYTPSYRRLSGKSSVFPRRKSVRRKANSLSKEVGIAAAGSEVLSLAVREAVDCRLHARILSA
jgi:hypothetical protein